LNVCGGLRAAVSFLLKRVSEIDMEHCPNCGSDLKIIATLPEQPVAEKILTHLGLQACAPPRTVSRCRRRPPTSFRA
jgi:hypothetical protein